MKTRILSTAAIIFSAICTTLMPAQAVKLSEQQTARAQKYLQLRNDYAKTEAYNPYERHTEVITTAREQFEEKKYDDVLKTIEPVLTTNPYSVDFLPLKIATLRQLGKEADAQAAIETYKGIIDSVLMSGDGRTAKTAMQVISTSEEYSVIGALDARLVKQSLVKEDGHFYDRMTICSEDDTSETPKTIDLYFNIDRPYNSLSKSLAPATNAPADEKAKPAATDKK